MIAASRRAVLAGLAATAALGMRGAGAAGSYLDGQTLRLIIPGEPGGAADQNGRTIVEHLRRLLPRTEILAENQGRAAGKLAAQMLWEAPPDGLTIATFNAGLLYDALLKPGEAPYEFGRFAWLGSLSRDRKVVIVTKNSGLETIQDMIGKPVIAPANATTSSHYTEALLLNWLIGTRIKPVPGYDGATRRAAAMSGEVQCMIGTVEYVSPVVEAGGGHPVLRLNDVPMPDAYGETPALRSLVADPEKRWVVDLIEAHTRFGGAALGAPPGTPPERVAVLQDVIAQLAAMPDYIAAAATYDLKVAPSSGAEMESLMSRLFSDVPHRTAELQDILRCGMAIAEKGSC